MFDEDLGDEYEYERLNHYIEIGAIELSGIDDDGQFIYGITNKAKDVAPELWSAHMDHIDNVLQNLYEEGYVEIEYDENLEASFRMTQEGLNVAREYGIIPMDSKELPNN